MSVHPINAEARAALARALLGIIIAALLYLTTVPFRMEQSSNFAKKWERAEIIPFHLRKGERYHPSDLLGNFLLFIPFGFALQGWRMEKRRDAALRIWPVVGGGMLFSLGIEMAQFFLRDRYTSINDWVLNVAGAGVGALAARRFYSAGLDRGLLLLRRIAQRPGVMALLALLATHALWQLQPFNFTLSTNNMLRKWLQWKFSLGYLAALPREILTLDRREYWPLAAVEYFLFGAIVGGQFTLCWRWYWPARAGRFWGGLAFVAALVMIIALLQFLVIGSNPDVLPLLAMAAGLVLGTMAMKNLSRGAAELYASPLQPPRAEGLLFASFLLLFALLVLRPDLPDLRVLQIPGSKEFSSLHPAAFFTALLASVHPSRLSLGGSAYFRLFLKLLLITVPLAFAFAKIQRDRSRAGYRQNAGRIMALGVGLGLAAQALRFFIWGSSVSLLAVAALALGGAAGTRLESWWNGFKPDLHKPNPEQLT